MRGRPSFHALSAAVLSCVVALGLLGGCSVLTDLSGFSEPPSGSDGQALADARADGNVGPELESGADEAGIDGGAAASGCGLVPGAAFCVDFEGPSPLSLSTWSEIADLTRMPARSITLTQQAPVSAPNAVLFDLAGGGTGCEYSRLEKRFPGTYATFTARYNVRSDTEGILFAESFTVNASLSFTLIVVLGAPLQVRIFGQKNVNNTITEVAAADLIIDSPYAGRWLPISVEYTSQPAKTATLAIGTKKVSFALPPEFVARDGVVGFGPYCADVAMRAALDDIAVLVAP